VDSGRSTIGFEEEEGPLLKERVFKNDLLIGRGSDLANSEYFFLRKGRGKPYKKKNQSLRARKTFQRKDRRIVHCKRHLVVVRENIVDKNKWTSKRNVGLSTLGLHAKGKQIQFAFKKKASTTTPPAPQ